MATRRRGRLSGTKSEENLYQDSEVGIESRCYLNSLQTSRCRLCYVFKGGFQCRPRRHRKIDQVFVSTKIIVTRFRFLGFICNNYDNFYASNSS